MNKCGKKILFSYKDTWSLDSVLSPIIASALKKYKEVCFEEDKKKGCCLTCLKETVGDKVEYSEDDINTGLKEFKRRLDLMIYAFDTEEPCDTKDTPQEYRKHLEEYYTKKQKGLDYFSKHFNDLWW